jgi:hypothetical protein
MAETISNTVYNNLATRYAGNPVEGGSSEAMQIPEAATTGKSSMS